MRKNMGPTDYERVIKSLETENPGITYGLLGSETLDLVASAVIERRPTSSAVDAPPVYANPVKSSKVKPC